MSTVNRTLNGQPMLIAQGPQDVTINFSVGFGQFFVEDAVTPGTTPPPPNAGAGVSNPTDGAFLGQNPQSMTLAADQAVYVSGAGKLVVICTNPEPGPGE